MNHRPHSAYLDEIAVANIYQISLKSLNNVLNQNFIFKFVFTPRSSKPAKNFFWGIYKETARNSKELNENRPLIYRKTL